MDQIAKLYILLNREFSAGSAQSCRRKILQMKANGRSYESQLASNAETIIRVVGDIPFQEPAHILAVLAVHSLIPRGRIQAEIFDRMTFGWFEFDDGIKGGIAAEFRPEGTKVRAHSGLTAAPVQHAPTRQSPNADPSDKMVIEREAPTVEEALQLVHDRMPLLSRTENATLVETILAKGAPNCVRWTFQTLEAVEAKMKERLPPQATLLGQHIVQEPLSASFEVEAFNQGAATALAHERRTQGFDTFDVKPLVPPKNGLFGLWKAVGRYTVSASGPAIVEVTYREPAKVRIEWLQEPASLMTVGRLKELNARQVPADELRALVKGAKVTHRLVDQSIRTWINNPDGNVSDLITIRAGHIGPSSPYAGTGTWSVDAKGHFCIKAQWNHPRGEDNSCRLMFQVGSTYYGVHRSSMNRSGTFVGAYEFSGGSMTPRSMGTTTVPSEKTGNNQP